MSETTDPLTLAARGAILHGPTDLASFVRLVDALAVMPPREQVHWRAAFRNDRSFAVRPPQLHLTGHADLAVPCVRCLEPLSVQVAIDHYFRLVRDEAQAAVLDEQADDHDVIAIGEDWNLLELLEDELLLALPLIPRHENCNLAGDTHAVGGDTHSELLEERQFPFADLAARLNEVASPESTTQASTGPTTDQPDEPSANKPSGETG